MHRPLNPDLGKRPIPGAFPAGQEARGDNGFEDLALEIGKLSSPSLSGGVDWHRIVDLADRILSERSKDLLVTSYLCAALLETDGLTGLAQGMHILRDILETYWDNLFPVLKRMRGRKNAMEWLVERLRTILPNLPVEAWPTAKRDAFLDDLNAIDRFLSGNMDDTPMLLPLINELSSLVTILPEEATPQDVPPAETSAPATLAGPAVSPPPASRLINPDGEGGETWIRQGLEALGRASACLMARGVADPLAYRLNRIAAWGAVTDLPPAAGSRTLLPGPDSQVVGLLQNLYRSERWEDLLQAAESRVPQFLFWMDLSRYTALSLERLGHESARHAVVSETRHYIERLEGLEGLAFEDGTPFADEETRAWIKTLRGRYPESGEKASPDNGPSVPLDVETALVEARRQIVDNRLSEAMQPFCSVLRGGFASMKERFAWQHGFCRLLLDMKQPRLALPHLLDLLEAIDIYRIDQWEPPLAVAAMQTILKGLRIQPEKDERRIEDLLSRLSRIDPLKAMDFF